MRNASGYTESSSYRRRRRVKDGRPHFANIGTGAYHEQQDRQETAKVENGRHGANKKTEGIQGKAGLW